MAVVSYAMFWRSGDGPRVAGRVLLDADAVQLEATVPPAELERIPFADIANVVVNRGVLHLIRRVRPTVSMGSLDSPGVLRELADRLSAAARA